MITNDLRVGLKLSPKPAYSPKLRSVLVDGPDVSWIGSARLGADQGEHGACGPAAVAAGAEIIGRAIPNGLTIGNSVIHGVARNVTNVEVLDAYYAITGGLDIGTTFPEAIRSSIASGWHTGATGARMEFDLSRLAQQPIFAGMEITTDWVDEGNVMPDGRFKSLKSTDSLGFHAVVILGAGVVPQWGEERWIYHLTPWRLKSGKCWGWKGITPLPASYHDEWVRELWTIF